MNHCIVYQSYGQIDIINELIYSIYTLIKQYDYQQPPQKIIVYSDQIQYLKKYLPEYIEFKEIDRPQILKWSGPNRFLHRVKVEIIKDVFKNYECSILYADSDTTFLSRPDELFSKIDSGNFIMHKNEGLIASGSNITFKKLKKILKDKDLQTKIKIPTETNMYNAGVLGIPYSYKNLLDDVLEKTDLLYDHTGIHCMEQLSFSYILNEHSLGKIVLAEPYIFHYWNFKEYRAVLDNFFTYYSGKPYQLILTKIDIINPQVLIKPKMQYENLSFFPKAMRKLKKKRWMMPLYTLD
ncbi:hypothetical protein CHU_0606 [Sporocytophaga myxococcoides]|uniref:Nucleotide-diphospho-sugar transferase domain-containing protein n=1 Tax=Sporocytophaga myxococcoides TaxID=153721 RepID=A0A098L8F9_9BACT|nr:hypothetical protein [Sporocytophaga myxococcoides]GAL83035.1 hypothetical protein CHU_0606 [Sporocytophaga myxococcoides]